MESEKRALLYGEDQLLLDTRAYLLRGAKMDSVCTRSLVDFGRQLPDPCIGVAILCHTLSLPDLSAALSLIALHRGELGRIILVSAFSPELPAMPEVFPIYSDRPDQLVESARLFLGTIDSPGGLAWLNIPAPSHGSTTPKAMGS